jgi:hypothetical protein
VKKESILPAIILNACRCKIKMKAVCFHLLFKIALLILPVAESYTNCVGAHVQSLFINAVGGIGTIQVYGPKAKFCYVRKFKRLQAKITFGFTFAPFVTYLFVSLTV